MKEDTDSSCRSEDERLREYFGGNTESILNGLLANSPFKQAIETRMGEKFPVVYDALTACLPPELIRNIIIYPWQKQIKTEILKEVRFRPRQGELPLFVLVYRRSWNRISERPLIISNKAVYMPKGNIYKLADIYKNYFEEKKGRMYLKNFTASHQWERAAIHLIEAVMLIFGGRLYDEDISGIIRDMINEQARVIKMPEPGMIKRVYGILAPREKADASKRILVPGDQYGDKKIAALKKRIHNGSSRYTREKIIFAYDLSAAASGKAGLLFTSAGVYIRDIALSAYIPYGDIYHIENTRKDFTVNKHRVVTGNEEDGYKLKQCLQLLIAWYTCKEREMIDGTRKVISVHKAPRRIQSPGEAQTPGRSRENKTLPVPEIRHILDRLEEENRQRILYPENEEHRARLSNLCKKLSSRYPSIAEEKAVFAIDTSLAFDGRSGIVAGEKGIYFSELSGMNFIAYDEINSIMRKGGQIYINGERVYVFGRKDIVLMADVLMQLARRHDRGVTSNIDEIPQC